MPKKVSKDHEELMDKKPTIQELERLLNSEDTPVQILPNGESVRIEHSIRNKDYSLVRVVDLAKAGYGSRNFSVVKTYNGPAVFIACQAFTALATKAKLTTGLKSIASLPTTVSVHTNIDEETTLFQSGIAIFDDGGMVLAAYIPDGDVYHVELAGPTEQVLNHLNALWECTLEGANFYRGKCLHYRQDGLAFFSTPKTKFDDVILPDDVISNFYNNTVGFLGKKTIVNRRSVILYGPPGCGKTSLISAAIHEAVQAGVGTIMVTGDAFRRTTPEHLMDFALKFLCPCLMVFEDFDLIAIDRNHAQSTIIGDVLAVLDGADKRTETLVIIGSTNRFDSIDQAAVRPCRFDRRIKIDHPNKAELARMWNKMGGQGTIPQRILEQEDITGAHVVEVIKSHLLFPDASIYQVVNEVLDSFFVSNGSKQTGFGSRRKTADPDEAVPKAARITDNVKADVIGPCSRS
jgi:hypothetical protein